MTYGDVFNRFRSMLVKGYKDGMISDCRPCVKPYFHTDIPEGLMIWLGNGDRIIYIPKEEEQKGADSTMTYAEMVYDIVKSKSEGMDAVYEDYIIHLVGFVGLSALKENRLLETCGVNNGRQLYVLCEKK